MASTTPAGDVNIAGGTTNMPVASTIDGVNDYIPIYTASALATQAINRNTYLGLASAPVGLTDSQTLTTKTLTNPTINGATFSGNLIGTYTIGGTPTFPASVVTLTGSQTLTNKILTSPTINAPTITNATISADAITGFTTSTNGTFYGISIASSVITTAGSVGSGANVTNGVQAAALATNAITLGYTPKTTTFSSTTAGSLIDVTGLSVTVTVPSGGRNIKITAFAGAISSTEAAGQGLQFMISEGATPLNGLFVSQPVSGYGIPAIAIAYVSAPSAGSHTYKVQIAQAAAGTIVLSAGASAAYGAYGPAFILVEAI